MKHVMVDLETLGNGSNACIIAIGAVEFDETSAALGREYYAVVDPQTSVESGGQIDAGTVMWWMQQDAAARSAFKTGGMHINAALQEFAAWFPQGATFWGNGATFDNVILANAYKRVGMKAPWSFSNDRCYRTLKNLRPDVPLTRTGTHHNALEDAKSQALHAADILQALKG